MKKSIVIPVLPVAFSLILFSLAGGMTSTIQEVDIFPSGAAITRSIEIESQGSQELTVAVDNLPAALIPSSIRISPEDNPAMQIGGFTFLPNENPVKPDDPRTAVLREAVDRLDAAIREVKQAQSVVEARIAHYSGVADSIRQSLKEKADEATFDLALKAWESVESTESEGQARLAELADRMKQLHLERQTAQEDLNEEVAKLGKRSGVLRFVLHGDLADGARLALNYQVGDAGWNPVHEIRALPGEGSIEWIYKAKIWQRTGEDWTDARATLKSASALYAADLPVLDPLYLSHREPQPYMRKMADSVTGAAMAPMVMEAEAVQPASTTSSFLVELPDTLTLVSGEEPVVKTAFTGHLEADFWSEAVPELSTDAWLKAGTTNDLGWPVLSGEAYAYIDGQLVSRKHLPSIPAGEEIDLALGKNEKIVIERHERKRKEAEGGLIDRTRRHEIKYETIVRNRMLVAHRVVLQERFPVGRDNKIQVRTVSPKDVEPEEGKGLFKWERTLEPGGETVMITEYTVTYPAEWTLFPPL